MSLNDQRIDALVSFHYSENSAPDGDRELMENIMQPIIKWTGYNRTSAVHAVLATIIRDSSIHRDLDRVMRYADADVESAPCWLAGYEHYDNFELVPFGKAELRRNYKKLFGVDLNGMLCRSCLQRLCEAKILVPVKSFYLINVPYIVRALTGHRYENRDTQEERQVR